MIAENYGARRNALSKINKTLADTRTYKRRSMEIAALFFVALFLSCCMTNQAKLFRKGGKLNPQLVDNW
ncbi:unnamed protein product [Sphenostylis stenocarpa]|uniref:Uncharacterized protein n=1 Tax=Sphenostylis stenocarpa TaxID=92480 RepID=A0AA86VCZ7_9FABA|nr:unnamed protein product [Sphenostylis stenocarpa]